MNDRTHVNKLKNNLNNKSIINQLRIHKEGDFVLIINLSVFLYVGIRSKSQE